MNSSRVLIFLKYVLKKNLKFYFFWLKSSYRYCTGCSFRFFHSQSVERPSFSSHYFVFFQDVVFTFLVSWIWFSTTVTLAWIPALMNTRTWLGPTNYTNQGESYHFQNWNMCLKLIFLNFGVEPFWWLYYCSFSSPVVSWLDMIFNVFCSKIKKGNGAFFSVVLLAVLVLLRCHLISPKKFISEVGKSLPSLIYELKNLNNIFFVAKSCS